MPREKLWLVRVHPHGQAVEQGLSCEMRASTYADPYNSPYCIDCFTVEECRNPALRGKPLAVTQKYLVVTANYPAREAGVTK